MIFVLLVLYVLCLSKRQVNKCFYQVEEICPQLNNICKEAIIEEYMTNNQSGTWVDWPEKLIDEGMEWKIIPFCAFGKWIQKNLDHYPLLGKFLTGISGIKLAGLSRLGPRTTLTPHQGWANHSNHHLRCHYGIDVPQGCQIIVYNEKTGLPQIQSHATGKWIIFDDSKVHTAVNPSNNYRTVLIVDVERPSHVKIGSAVEGDITELNNFILAIDN